jgi:methylenetetrahydrofolate dehydrogenase (NADP+)/methenyltetrahydrofolate cyclohydrolase
MNPKIMDGKALSLKRQELLKQKLAIIRDSRLRGNDGGNLKPKMVSFCNTEDLPSVKYTKMKSNKAEEIGIEFIIEEYTLNIKKEEIIEKVKRYNDNEEIDGIMFQMPMPEEFYPCQDELINSIKPTKDVDGLIADGPYTPATVKAVISLMDEYVPDWDEKKIAVIGITGEVGRPLGKILKSKNIDLVGINSRVGNLETDLKDRDIVIASTGHKNLVKPDMLKRGVVLIDVGLGDFEEDCYEVASLYTPIFGGVGPMTVISLMENAVESFERRG